MSYSNLLHLNMRDNNTDNNIIDVIVNKKYDVIIYGSYHMDLPY